MTRYRLTVSSGTGPLEVRSFVRLLSAAIATELARDQAVLEHMVVHGPHQAPSSVDLLLEGTLRALQPWVGTHALLMQSARRGKRDRKRWYAGVMCDEAPILARSPLDLSDVVVETCRAGGAGGQHVNRTESAVRATHRPSGLSVRIESERSQHQNRARALELLEQALQREHHARLADAKSGRRLRALHVERGRPVMVWRLRGDDLVREETQHAT